MQLKKCPIQLLPQIVKILFVLRLLRKRRNSPAVDRDPSILAFDVQGQFPALSPDKEQRWPHQPTEEGLHSRTPASTLTAQPLHSPAEGKSTERNPGKHF